jgi:hypothetical protein
MPTKKKKVTKKTGINVRKTIDARTVELFYSKSKPPELLFTLYSDGRVEASEELDYCLWLELTGINDAEGTRERARFSKALLRLAEYYGKKNQISSSEDAEFGPLPVEENSPEPDPRKLLEELSATLGTQIFGNSKAIGKSVQYAVEGIQRWKKGEKKTLKKPNLVLMIHRKAKEIIRNQKRLPFQNEIRQQLEADGWNPKGKTAWSDAFTTAGLAGLEIWDESAWEESMRRFPLWSEARGKIVETDLLKEFPKKAEKLRGAAKKYIPREPR